MGPRDSGSSLAALSKKYGEARVESVAQSNQSRELLAYNSPKPEIIVFVLQLRGSNRSV